jgi:PHP family Zn ribbon phosphoesterase
MTLAGRTVTSMFSADLRIQSEFSPTCSRDCDIEHLASRAVLKNTMSVSSGDFTRCLGLRTAQHPCRSLAANGAAILSLNSGNPRPACPSTRR